MKIDRLETHDRLLTFKKEQLNNIQNGLSDCLFRNPLSLALQEYSPYIYIFAHPRTADDGINKRMLWQPRLTKPQAQTNSYLFRGKSKTDTLEICWMIPAPEMWGQYKKGNVTEHAIVEWSVEQFIHNKQGLEQPEPDDLDDEKINWIYQQVRCDLRADERGDLIKLKSLDV